MKGTFVWYTAQKFLLVFAGVAMTFLVFSKRFYLYLVYFSCLPVRFSAGDNWRITQ